MFAFFRDLDRRWIFLAMFLAIAIPLLSGIRFPEQPSQMVRNVFQEIDQLEDGSDILLAFDFDPASQGELQPMAAAFTRHCALKRHKLYFMTLWPTGVPMIEQNIRILTTEFPEYNYGTDYVNLGYKPGQEVVIQSVTSEGNLQTLFTTDNAGASLKSHPMTESLGDIQKMALIVNVSAGTPGAKEWVQYAATPFGLKMVAGTTGVGAPALYPYIPNQLRGILGAIKAAAEYEQALIEKFPDLKENKNSQEGLRRMGPQLVAHLLIIGLIVVGNIIFFVDRKRGTAS